MAHRVPSSTIPRVQVVRRIDRDDGSVQLSRFTSRVDSAQPTKPVMLMNQQVLATRPPAATIPLSGEQALHSAEQAYRRLLADQPQHFRALCGLAVVRSQRGAIDEALGLLGRAAALASRCAKDHLALGTAFARIKDLDGARRHFEEAVTLDEEHSEARFHLANILVGSGDIAGAVTQYQRAVALDPSNAEAHQNLGLALQRLDQHEAAIAHYEAALSLEPKSAFAHIGLGDALRHLDRYDDAIREYEHALTIDPNLTEAHVNLGGSFQAIGRPDDAIRWYQRALTINPSLADAHYNLGNLYVELDNLDAAICHYERSIELHPASAEAHNNLANVLQTRARHEAAIERYKEAIRLKPDYASAHRNLANALKSLNRFDEAIAHYRTALASEPENVTTLNLLASAMAVAGRLDDASRTFQTAIEIAPQNLGIQLNYATTKKFSRGDPRLARLEQLAAREETLPDRDRIALHFTLGKAFADLRDGERSFFHLSTGNRIKRKYITYDEYGTLAHFDRIRDFFSRDLLREKSGKGYPSATPVFVLGMPRSGTSLVEQIIASHPRVYGAGELNHLAMVTSEFAERLASTYPEMLPKMPDGDLGDLGKTYVERMSALAAPADRIVDKMPSNFMFVGLIHLALPRARIIHVKRDPVDTCLSCFSLLFSEDQPFTYDLAEVGRYYKAYEALMAHWRTVLPEGAMLEVQYEDLVGDLEGHARRLIEYCGLDWDQRCLSFHETKRPVRTASLVQVREPIHAKSVGRWRFYGARLKPLLDVLGIDASQSEAAEGCTLAAGASPTQGGRKDDENGVEARIARAFQLATELQQSGKLDHAERLLTAVLAVRPNHFGSLTSLGSLCANANRLDEAKACFERIIAANPNSGDAHASLAAVYAARSELDAAVACYEKALRLAPYHPGIHYGFATVLQSLDKSEEGIQHLRLALAVRPAHLESHFLLGNLLYAMGKDREAAVCYLKVLQLNPRHPETHNNLGNVLLRQGHAERAIAYYKTAFEINPSYADAHGNLGNALLELNRLEESIEQNRRALELKPTRFGSYNNLGVAFQALGRFKEASEAFERAIELSPDEASVHLNLANMHRFKSGDRRLPALRRLLDVVDSLDAEKQIAAHFAMGKAYSDLKQFDKAFQQLAKANALKRQTFVYDEAQRLAMFENIKMKFPAERFQAQSGHGDTSWSPIFIVGMPRSGTTLMEQVLASHSKVFGAGELETFKELVGECAKNQGVPPAYPDLLESLSPERITELGQLYTKRVRAIAPDAEHIVDKMPLNFVFVGLIHLALPSARIIHIRRDPLDTCVSCYSLLFTGSQPFAYDLAELGRYYRGYETVMEHWHRVLPPGVMMDVRYEDLVEDIEGIARGVLQHCGLEWEDTCRNFHDTKRTVRTASLMQVRKPLYRSSLGGWRRYAKYLKPLAEALGQDVPARVVAAEVFDITVPRQAKRQDLQDDPDNLRLRRFSPGTA
jgi:tetratricopeptide (TPR) repeat protein